MAKDGYYFSHDYNARNDRKMRNLRCDKGMAGLGIYWCLIEMLYEEGGYLKLSECESIAIELQTDVKDIQDIIHNYGLFKLRKVTFYSISALTRIERRKAKTETARKSARAGWAGRKQDPLRGEK